MQLILTFTVGTFLQFGIFYSSDTSEMSCKYNAKLYIFDKVMCIFIYNSQIWLIKKKKSPYVNLCQTYGSEMLHLCLIDTYELS